MKKYAPQRLRNNTRLLLPELDIDKRQFHGNHQKNNRTEIFHHTYTSLPTELAKYSQYLNKCGTEHYHQQCWEDEERIDESNHFKTEKKRIVRGACVFSVLK